jgi:hypothetical protein
VNSCLTVKVEMSAGTHIDDAAVAAIDLATKLGCWVEFKFNDVECHAAPDSDPEVLAEQFHAASKPGTRYPMAFAHTKSEPDVKT